jgi:hypothetical protein
LKPPLEFSSFYGNGAHLSSACEGRTIFDDLFPDVGSEPETAPRNAAHDSVVSYFEAVSRTAGRPWLVKNARNGSLIGSFLKLFPRARFIRLRRARVFVAQSILQGRYVFKGDPSINWTVVPRGWKDLRDVPYPEQVARQVFFLERQIDRDLGEVRPSQVVEVRYDEFCAEPLRTARRIAGRFSGVGFREGVARSVRTERFECSNRRTVDPETYERIQTELELLEKRHSAALPPARSPLPVQSRPGATRVHASPDPAPPDRPLRGGRA